MFQKSLPTTDLYFLNSCNALVGGRFTSKPVRRRSQNWFQTATSNLLIRKETPQNIAKILADTNRALVYLLDDNLWAGAVDTSLPDGYRARLDHLLHSGIEDILKKANLIVVSNPLIGDEIAGRYGRARDTMQLLHPFWLGTPPKNLSVRRQGEPFNLVHLGTDSHGAGKQFVDAVVEALAAERDDFILHTFGKSPEITRLPTQQLRPHKGMSWAKYKARFPHYAFDLGLYPVGDGAFNQARSLNKVFEYTVMGCPLICSRDWPLIEGLDLLKVENTVEQWVKTVKTMMDEENMRQDAYDKGVQVFRQYNDGVGQMSFWRNHLRI